jgi:glutamine synthetase
MASHRSAFAASRVLPCGSTRFASRTASRSQVATTAQFCDDADLDAAGFGQHVFKGDVAAKYLSKYGESAALLDTPAWTATKSDTVASALLDWARDNGASVYCHWFCPMGSSGALRW